MPISDMVFSVIGVADYVLLLLIIVATGFVTRKKAHTAEKQTQPAAGKCAGGKPSMKAKEACHS